MTSPLLPGDLDYLRRATRFQPRPLRAFFLVLALAYLVIALLNVRLAVTWARLGDTTLASVIRESLHRTDPSRTYSGALLLSAERLQLALLQLGFAGLLLLLAVQVPRRIARYKRIYASLLSLPEACAKSHPISK